MECLRPRPSLPVWQKRISLVFIGMLFLLGGTRCHAGAWNQAPGHCQVIFTTSYFQTRKQFDSSGANEPFGYGGQFRQLSFNPYTECGLSRRYGIVLNFNAPLLRYGNQFAASNSAGLGDVEVGIKRRLNALESNWAISAQLTAMFPAYSATRNPAPGNHQEDVEVRFLVGRGSMWAHRRFFWDAESAYRYRSGAPADQFRADFTSGYTPISRIMAMGQIFAITGLRNGSPFSATNPNAQSDFDLYKAQASLVILVGHGVRLQPGWNTAFSGRNTGSGQTVFVGLWKNF
jgi:protein XagA